MKIATISTKGSGKVNEDRVGFKDNLFWVIDGATSLGRRLFPAETDAEWMARELDLALKEAASEASLLEILQSAVELVHEKAKVLGIDFCMMELYEQPCCTLAMARLRHDTLEYLVMGDCSIVIPDDNGKTKIITDIRGDFDSHDTKKIQDAVISQNIPLSEAVKQFSPLIREHRALMNKPSGKQFVTITGESLAIAITGSVEVKQSGSIILCSDGFSIAVDGFGLYTWEQVLHSAVSLDQMVRELRQAEEADQNAVKVPRYKVSDDATALRVDR
jgi:serine/threonine protein phosphatase PrpC